MNREEHLRLLRENIDSLDEQILYLLNKRAEVVIEIGKIKSEIYMESYDQVREQEIFDSLKTKNSGPLPESAIDHIFCEIISACRSLVKKNKIAYLGPPASYSHLACVENFGNSIEAISKENIDEVFEAIEKGEVEFGVVPIENSIEGVVNRTLDMFIEYDVKICGEIFLKISHCLISLSVNPNGIRNIYSHPQALGQCRKWLKKNYPKAQFIETFSTAKAAEIASKEKESAAIASPIAAKLYGLKILNSHIEDSAHNYTRFFLIGLKTQNRTGKDKTSILFSIRHVPGSLYKVLKNFSENGINLTKIESRPIKGRPWEYFFFIDFEGHIEDPEVNKLLLELKEQVIFLKILGSYPRRQ